MSSTSIPDPRRSAAQNKNGVFVDVWINAKRWTNKTLRNPFSLAGSLVQPVIFLVLFSKLFGGVMTTALRQEGFEVEYVTFLVPAIAIHVALATAGNSGVGLVNDIDSGMFEKVLATPMSQGAVFFGKTASEFAQIVLQVGLVLALGFVLGADIATGVAGAIGISVVAILFALWFVALSNIVAVVSKDQESTVVAAYLLQFPLLFLSPAFLPLGSLPGWVRAVAPFNPVTYGVDAARAIMLGRDLQTAIHVGGVGGVWATVLPAVLVLVALDVVFGALAVYAVGSVTSADVQ